MDEEPKSIERFHFSFSLDRKNFFRWACPSCGLEFKTKPEPGELASVLQPAFRPLGFEIGEDPNHGESDQLPTQFMCPYCGYQSEAFNFLTVYFHRYLERFILREYMLPKINSMFEDFADSIGNNRSLSGGFLSIELSMNFNRSLYPPRPIAGPEPGDMKIVNLLCCNKQIKILENWNCTIFCPYCNGVAILQ